MDRISKYYININLQMEGGENIKLHMYLINNYLPLKTIKHHQKIEDLFADTKISENIT
ncbi:hypothetical protein [Thalassobellus suaedae]|uniref:Uncharacterized protein n=1 Tax=Thalassobellus suaedae TaxID=3074124 RepID=A0ABY9Y3R4_9FLAO|nr:hypothetical protein RHP49_16595 [Flavobacteriaceae bacterium HL-DH10]